MSALQCVIYWYRRVCKCPKLFRTGTALVSIFGLPAPLLSSVTKLTAVTGDTGGILHLHRDTLYKLYCKIVKLYETIQYIFAMNH